MVFCNNNKNQQPLLYLWPTETTLTSKTKPVLSGKTVNSVWAFTCAHFKYFLVLVTQFLNFWFSQKIQNLITQFTSLFHSCFKSGSLEATSDKNVWAAHLLRKCFWEAAVRRSGLGSGGNSARTGYRAPAPAPQDKFDSEFVPP